MKIFCLKLFFRHSKMTHQRHYHKCIILKSVSLLLLYVWAHLYNIEKQQTNVYVYVIYISPLRPFELNIYVYKWIQQFMSSAAASFCKCSMLVSFVRYFLSLSRCLCRISMPSNCNSYCTVLFCFVCSLWTRGSFYFDFEYCLRVWSVSVYVCSNAFQFERVKKNYNEKAWKIYKLTLLIKNAYK